MRHPGFPIAGRRAAAARCRGTFRQGFTLLEVILALAIGALLLVGLYYALDVSMGHTYSGRKLVERTRLTQGVVNRIRTDILASLPPVDPNFAPSQSGSSSSSSSSTTSSSSSSSGSSSSATPTNPFTFNLGVQGTSTQLTIYASALPR